MLSSQLDQHNVTAHNTEREGNKRKLGKREAVRESEKKKGKKRALRRQTYFPSLSCKILFDWLLSGRGPWWLQLCHRAKEGNTKLLTFSVKTSFAQMVSF